MKYSIPLLLLSALLAGCASATMSGYGQGGQQADGRSYTAAQADNSITAAVNRLLVRDPRIHAMDIDVTTVQQVVTLAGSVPDRDTARLAEKLAASVRGVASVVNQLQISH